MRIPVVLRQFPLSNEIVRLIISHYLWPVAKWACPFCASAMV
jgi:hypothetical protein